MLFVDDGYPQIIFRFPDNKNIMLKYGMGHYILHLLVSYDFFRAFIRLGIPGQMIYFFINFVT